MIITFIGHSCLYKHDFLIPKISSTIIENLSYNDPIVFYCGGYGDFDNICNYTCHLIKNTKKISCEIVFITPYITMAQQEKIKHLINSQIYDSVIYPPLEHIPAKFAIIKRNEWMIEQADLVIAYVKNNFGGAYTALKYAEKKKKRIINLA